MNSRIIRPREMRWGGVRVEGQEGCQGYPSSMAGTKSTRSGQRRGRRGKSMFGEPQDIK